MKSYVFSNTKKTFVYLDEYSINKEKKNIYGTI